MISRFAPVLIGLVSAAVIAIVVVGQVTKDDSYTVYAKFQDAGGILKNYNVKIGGVAAGTVSGVSLDDQDNAVLKLSIDKSAAPIGAGATAKVRPVNLLGEKFVDLDPGDLRKPQPEGSTIGTDKTDVPVEIDDALNVLDPDTRGAMRILINEAGIAMAGRGTDFNTTLEELPRALDAAKAFVGQVAAENRAMDRAVVSGDRVLAALNAGRKDFANLVASAANALENVATKRSELGATVQSAPAALSQLRTTLTQLQGASVDLTPAAQDLRKAAPSLADTLARAPKFAQDAKATLATAVKVSPKLEKLGKQSTPTLRLLRPTSDRVVSFTNDFQPLLTNLDQQRSWVAFLFFMAGWAGVTDGVDGWGHHFRVRITADEQLLQGALDRWSPVASKKRGSGKRRTPSSSAPAQAPAAQEPAPKPKLPLQPLKPLVDSLDKGLQEIGHGVQDAVGSLLEGATGRRAGRPSPLFDHLQGR